MWKNYLKIMVRNVRKNIGYSAINLIGLAIGLACCLLILLWVQDELSFDRFHENKDQLVCMIRQEVDAEGETGSVAVPFALAPILKREFPEILDFSRYQERSWLESPVISYGGNTFYEPGMALVEPSFLRMFSFALLKGDPRTALQNVNSVVITEALAKKYFGAEEPLGKVLKYNNRIDLQVTAVLKNIPANSHLQFDLLAPLRMLGEQTINGWSWESLSYLLLKPGTRLAEMREKLAGSMTKYSPEGDKKWKINLLPITKFHLQQGEGDSQLVTIFSSIAIFILLIACMNYMNLATARSARRAREVGLRKVAGARRGQLVRQFLAETLLLTLLAAALALLLVLDQSRGLQSPHPETTVTEYFHQSAAAAGTVGPGAAGESGFRELSRFFSFCLQTDPGTEGKCVARFPRCHFPQDHGHRPVCHFHRIAYRHLDYPAAVALYPEQGFGLEP